MVIWSVNRLDVDLDEVTVPGKGRATEPTKETDLEEVMDQMKDFEMVIWLEKYLDVDLDEMTEQ